MRACFKVLMFQVHAGGGGALRQVPATAKVAGREEAEPCSFRWLRRQIQEEMIRLLLGQGHLSHFNKDSQLTTVKMKQIGSQCG